MLHGAALFDRKAYTMIFTRNERAYQARARQYEDLLTVLATKPSNGSTKVIDDAVFADAVSQCRIREIGDVIGDVSDVTVDTEAETELARFNKDNLLMSERRAIARLEQRIRKHKQELAKQEAIHAAV